jgi:hypothetical protein
MSLEPVSRERAKAVVQRPPSLASPGERETHHRHRGATQVGGKQLVYQRRRIDGTSSDLRDQSDRAGIDRILSSEAVPRIPLVDPRIQRNGFRRARGRSGGAFTGLRRCAKLTA